MALFTKKPVTVEASQWFKNGDHPQDYTKDVNNQFPDEGAPPVYTAAYRRENNWEGDVVRYYRHPNVPGDKFCEQCGKPHHVHGWIDTLEQGHRVCPGDWIITGVQGERYPCKPDIFAATYEPADRAAAQVEPSAPPAPGGDVLPTALDALQLEYVDACEEREHLRSVAAELRQSLSACETKIAHALRRHGLTLLKTKNSYEVRRLGPIEAQGQDAAPAEQPQTDAYCTACDMTTSDKERCPECPKRASRAKAQA